MRAKPLRPFRVLTHGPIPAQNVLVRWRPGVAIPAGSLRKAIDEFWRRSAEHPQAGTLFDGLVAALVGWQRTGETLKLRLSWTRYRTNWYIYKNAGEIQVPPPDVLPRALGVSAVVTHGGQIYLMRRSSRVAECPGLLDVFGGHIESADPFVTPNPQSAILAELEEELAVPAGNWQAPTCLGLVEVARTEKPEIIYLATPRAGGRLQETRTSSSPEVEEIISVDESDACQFLETHRTELTPSALGSLSLFADRWLKGPAPASCS